MNVIEIHLIIGDYIEKNSDLASCCRVARVWFEAYAPLLYRKLLLYYDRHGKPRQPWPSMGSIFRNGGFIRELFITSGRLLTTSVHAMCNLRRLSISSQEDLPENMTGDWLLARPLFLRNRQLTHLTISRFRGQGVSQCLELTAELCPQLEIIDLEFLTFTRTSRNIFLRNAKNLVSVSIFRCIITDDDEYVDAEDISYGRWKEQDSQDFVFPRLRILGLLSNTDERQYAFTELVARCPALERLELSQSASQSRLVHVPFKLPLLNRCPSLTELTLDSLSPYDPKELVWCLSRCPILSSFTVTCGQIETETLEALHGVFENLTRLDLFDCNIKSRMSKEILLSCPALVSFRLPILDGKDCTEDDRIRGTPCLQVLNARVIEIDSRSECEHIIRILKSLKQLKKIHIGKMTRFDFKDCVCSSWQYGDFRKHDMEQDPDWEWTLQTWPKLQEFVFYES